MLRRSLSLFGAVGLNMSMMVGVGPFVTIPLMLASVDARGATFAWLIAAVIAACDGLVWAELAAAFPGSGGTYHFFDAVYGESTPGRAMKFLFVWQFLASGPLEIGGGMLGFAAYAEQVWPALKQVAWRIPLGGELAWTVTRAQAVAACVMAGVVGLAYRRIDAAGRFVVMLWGIMLATMAWLIAASWSRFDPETAFARGPEIGFQPMGRAVSLAMFAYLGYYQICYLGDEVQRPEKVLPRSILISLAGVAAMYVAMNLGVLGVVPAVEAAQSTHVASDVMGRIAGPSAAKIFSGLVMTSAVAGSFAALLSYSRVPYAAARSGHFFVGLGATHPRGDFPHRSVLLVGGLAVMACGLDLEAVIMALLTTRILIQFIAQVATVFYIRSKADLSSSLRFRMPLWPAPAIVALLGWTWIAASAPRGALIAGVATTALGLVVFVFRERRGR